MASLVAAKGSGPRPARRVSWRPGAEGAPWVEGRMWEKVLLWDEAGTMRRDCVCAWVLVSEGGKIGKEGVLLVMVLSWESLPSWRFDGLY